MMLFCVVLIAAPLEFLLRYEGYEYRGTQNKTEYGKTCQSWSSQKVYPNSLFSDATCLIKRALARYVTFVHILVSFLGFSWTETAPK